MIATAPLELIDETPFSDDELALLALTGDPDQPLDPAAVPFAGSWGTEDGLLPGWYMPAPAPTVGAGRPWRRIVVVLLIMAFIAINAVGMCVTYGSVMPA
jgi:hypothetical protein